MSVTTTDPKDSLAHLMWWLWLDMSSAVLAGAAPIPASNSATEGKTPREIKRCLKHAIAREVYRIMQTHAQSITTTKTAA